MGDVIIQPTRRQLAAARSVTAWHMRSSWAVCGATVCGATVCGTMTAGSVASGTAGHGTAARRGVRKGRDDE